MYCLSCFDSNLTYLKRICYVCSYQFQQASSLFDVKLRPIKLAEWLLNKLNSNQWTKLKILYICNLSKTLNNYSPVPNKHPPDLLIFKIFVGPPPFPIKTPYLLNFFLKNCFLANLIAFFSRILFYWNSCGFIYFLYNFKDFKPRFECH